jgi:hypothetical protein
MTRKLGPAAWMGGAFCVALVTGLVALALLGTGARGVAFATESVARVTFVFFWLAYVGAALPTLFGSRFDALARHGREFGLAFAAALLVHLAFVAWLFDISIRPPVSDSVIMYFGIGALWTYALALGSMKRLRDLLGPTLWRIFSSVGLEYIAFLFFRDFVLLPLHYGARYPPFYAPFSILIIAGILLRWLGILLRYHRQSHIERPIGEINAPAAEVRRKPRSTV